MNKIDLHTHSYCSLDGSESVQNLIDLAKRSNISYLAISDHNTTRAYRESFDDKGIHLIPAVELDCLFQGRSFHLLGYGIHAWDPIYEKIRQDNIDMERSVGRKKLQIVREQMGIYVDQKKLDALCSDGLYLMEMICEAALMEEENRHNPYLKEFFPGGQYGDSPYISFFWKYCAKGGMADVPMEFMSMEEAIRLYRSQNALIVLAHPGNNVKEDDRLLEDIIALGIDGLEVYSSYHDDAQIAYYHKKAMEHDLIMSAGSDYHGKWKPNVVMGECRMPKAEEEKLIHIIRDKIEKR